MKLKNIISRCLAVGLIFNSTYTSFASILSEDGRYETFEGDNITINNILEEDKVDIEIEGNTLVNLLGDDLRVNNSNTTEIKEDKTIIFTHTQIEVNTVSAVFFDEALVDKNKTYTLLFNIVENTLSRQDLSPIVAKFNIVSYNEGAHVIENDDIGIQKVVLKQPSTTTHNGKPYIELSNNTVGRLIIKDIVLLEGDYSDSNINYFEGMKSVGELENNLEVNVSNENLFNTSKLYAENFNGLNNNVTYQINEDSILITKKTIDGNSIDSNFIGTRIKCKKGKKYKVGFIGGANKAGANHTVYVYHDKPWGDIATIIGNPSDTQLLTKTFTAKTDEVFIGCYISSNTEENEVLEYKNVFVREEDESTYKRHEGYSKELILNEPLRGLPNGVKDRIIKRNGQWVIERNCWEGIITGNEVFYEGHSNWTNKVFGVPIKYKAKKDAVTVMWNADILTPRTVNQLVYNNITGIAIWDYEGFKVYVDVGKETMEETVDYIKENPIKYVYELETPIYEPLNIDLSLDLYLGATYISTNSTISANIKITVDRAINRAVEAIEIAKANPIVDNISKARYWNNLLKETINKDSLQNEINNITKIEDLEIDKKSVSANIDVYVKSDNALSITLSTNSIIFDNYSGVSDIENLNALEVTVHSSLPYNLNVYLENEIQNSDKSTTINSNLLQIKESKDLTYKSFINTVDKIVLEEDCPSGNYNKHSIDLKMEGSNAYKADIYKTIIKLEAEQK